MIDDDLPTGLEPKTWWSRWWPNNKTFPGRDVEGFYLLRDLPSVPDGKLALMSLAQGCHSDMTHSRTKLLAHYPLGDTNRAGWSRFFQQYVPPENECPIAYSKVVSVRKPLHHYFQRDVFDSGSSWKIEGSMVTSSLFEVQWPTQWALSMATVNSQWDANVAAQPFLDVAAIDGAIQGRYAVFVNDGRLLSYMRAKQIKGLRAILGRRMFASGKAAPHSGNLPVLIANVIGFNTRFMSSRMSPMLNEQQLTVDGILRDGQNGKFAHDSNVWNRAAPTMPLQCFQTLREQTNLSSQFVSNMLVLFRARDKLLVDSYAEVNVTATAPEPRKPCLYFEPNYLDIFLTTTSTSTLLGTERFKTDFSGDFFKCQAAYFPALDAVSEEWYLICVYMTSRTVVIHFPKYATRPDGLADRSAAVLLQLQQSLLPVFSHFFLALPPVVPAAVLLPPRRLPVAAPRPPAPRGPPPAGALGLPPPPQSPPPVPRILLPPRPPAVRAPVPDGGAWSAELWKAPAHEATLSAIETTFDSGLYIIWNMECRYYDIDMYFERQDVANLRKNIGYWALQSRLKLLD